MAPVAASLERRPSCFGARREDCENALDGQRRDGFLVRHFVPLNQRSFIMAKANPIPDGYTAVTPYLSVRGAAQAIDFYKRVFGAEELVRMPMPGGMVGHAELQIGDARIMLADEMPAFGTRSPRAFGGTPIGLCLYTKDCDVVFHRALQNGATQIRPLQDQFYGDRSGTIEDPFGFIWTIGTHIEDVSPEELQRRMASMPMPA